MRNLFEFLAFVSITVSLLLPIQANAQVPQKISYQAVIRDTDNNLVSGHIVGMRISILQGISPVYIETQTVTSNANGLITLEIGDGNVVSGAFEKINWSEGTYSIKTETDPTGGTAYSIIGTSQLLSVPFAFCAKTAENSFSGNYNDLNSKPALANVATSGNYNDLSNKPVTDGSETKITAGSNIIVSGTGTNSNPYLINSTETHFVGELFGGGVVFYVEHSGQHGLICGMTDLNDLVKWSNINVLPIGAAAQSDWDGQANTTAIINQPGHTESAAKLCDDYTNIDYGTGVFSNWYLPALSQLHKLFNALYEVNKTLEIDGNSSTAALLKWPYWSSTENSSFYAWTFHFYFQEAHAYEKAGDWKVRPIRNF